MAEQEDLQQNLIKAALNYLTDNEKGANVDDHDQQTSGSGMLQGIVKAMAQGAVEIVREPAADIAVPAIMPASHHVDQKKRKKKKLQGGNNENIGDDGQVMATTSEKEGKIKEKKKIKKDGAKKEKDKSKQKTMKTKKEEDSSSSSSSSSSSESEDDSLQEQKVSKFVLLGILGGLVMAIVGLMKVADACRAKRAAQPVQEIGGNNGTQVQHSQNKEEDVQIKIEDLRRTMKKIEEEIGADDLPSSNCIR